MKWIDDRPKPKLVPVRDVPVTGHFFHSYSLWVRITDSESKTFLVRAVNLACGGIGCFRPDKDVEPVAVEVRVLANP